MLFGLFLIGVVFFLIMNVPFLYNEVGFRFEGIVTNGEVEGSFRGRERMIALGWSLFRDNPLLGYGVNNFRALSPWNTYAHNNYVELLVDVGVIGTALFYFWAVVLLRRAIRTKYSKTNGIIMAVTLTVLLLGIMDVQYNSMLSLTVLFLAFIVKDLQDRTSPQQDLNGV